MKLMHINSTLFQTRATNSFYQLIGQAFLVWKAIGSSHHIVDFLGSRRMESAPTSIEVLLRPTLSQSDDPSDLRGSLSLTTQHRFTHVLVCTAPGSPRQSPIQLWTGPGVA